MLQPSNTENNTMRLMTYYPAKPAANMTAAQCMAFILGSK
jgi:hypothetical protein